MPQYKRSLPQEEHFGQNEARKVNLHSRFRTVRVDISGVSDQDVTSAQIFGADLRGSEIFVRFTALTGHMQFKQLGTIEWVTVG